MGSLNLRNYINKITNPSNLKERGNNGYFIGYLDKIEDALSGNNLDNLDDTISNESKNLKYKLNTITFLSSMFRFMSYSKLLENFGINAYESNHSLGGFLDKFVSILRNNNMDRARNWYLVYDKENSTKDEIKYKYMEFNNTLEFLLYSNTIYKYAIFNSNYSYKDNVKNSEYFRNLDILLKDNKITQKAIEYASMDYTTLYRVLKYNFPINNPLKVMLDTFLNVTNVISFNDILFNVENNYKDEAGPPELYQIRKDILDIFLQDYNVSYNESLDLETSNGKIVAMNLIHVLSYNALIYTFEHLFVDYELSFDDVFSPDSEGEDLLSLPFIRIKEGNSCKTSALKYYKLLIDILDNKRKDDDDENIDSFFYQIIDYLAEKGHSIYDEFKEIYG